jgi:hypothetical protein
LFWLAVACSFTIIVQAQKVQTGYDKSIDFSQYKTYSWVNLNEARARPLLFQLVVTNVDHELEGKGLKRVNSDADLLLFPSGGFDSSFAMSAGAPVGNYINQPLTVETASWVGPATMTTDGISPIVHAGTLVVAFVEYRTARLVWEGRVSDKFDPEKKTESMARLEKCITKLFKDFPPQRKEKD